MVSTELSIAMNLDPNLDTSNKFCLLLSHIIGVLLWNKNISVCDCLFSVYPT